MKPKLIIVAGPTAVGKTKYAIELAKKCNGEIVSLDSVQVYKEFDIGTAKPTKEELQEVPHYMIDEISPLVNLNVKEYKDMAMKYISQILDRKKVPILVGGSGFYIDAVLYDTEFIEEDKDETKRIRSELENIYDTYGEKYLHDMLAKVDEKSADAIPPANVKRVIRAIEFFKLHNMPISVHNEIEKKRESKFDYTFYVLNMDREKLYERINSRVDKMISDGLLNEVKTLISGGITDKYNAMNSIGYKELYDLYKKNGGVLKADDMNEKEKNELDKTIDMIKQHSRNYAKRQLTWFRSKKNVIWIMK